MLFQAGFCGWRPEAANLPTWYELLCKPVKSRLQIPPEKQFVALPPLV
jgi:hypothetical protein